MKKFFLRNNKYNRRRKIKEKSIMKYITLDIEGDISSKKCKEHFTAETLYRDPNTLTWLCSFYNGNMHKAFGILLPEVPRKFISKTTGKIESTVHGYHNKDNKFSDNVISFGRIGHKDDYRNFILNIANMINYCSKNGITIFFKGYYDKNTGRIDNYDLEQLRNLTYKYSIPCDFSCMKEAIAYVKEHYNINFWTPYTHNQKRQHTDNQTYMNNAVQHNLEDSETLWKCLNEVFKK